MKGTTLDNKYRLQSLLGSGGMGYVYRAEQIGLGRSVAIKFLHRDLAHGLARFHTEALSASRINHPNAVAIYDFGITDDGTAYLVMEHLRGRTLARVIADEPLSPRRILGISVQVLSALAEAHECGVVHCDLTSHNVIVDLLAGGDDFAKVIDFGLSRVFERQHGSSRSFGTPEYMAPEQIRGEQVTPAADVYAMGALLYEMLVGRTPFAGMAVAQILDAHCHRSPIPPHEVIPTCPQRLSELVMWALEKRPEDRPPSAEVLGAHLAELAPRARRCARCGQPAADAECPSCGRQPRAEIRPATGRFAAGSGPLAPRPGSRASALAPPAGEHARERHRRSTRFTCVFPGAVESTPGRESAAASPTSPASSTAPAPPIAPTAGPPGVPAALVGREAELAQVVAFLQDQRPQHGRAGGDVLAIVGPPGIGKARLVLDAAAQLALRVATFVAGPDPSGLQRSWYPVLSLLERVLGLEGPLSESQLIAAVARAGLPDRDVPGLADIFGLHPDGRDLEDSVRHREACAAARRALLSVARSFPRAVLCFADIDGYDRPSRAFVHELCAALRGCGVRVVITCHAAGQVPDGAEPIVLDGLAPHHSRELTGRLAATHDLPTALTIHALTHGSPCAIEQLAGWLRMGNPGASAPPLLVDLIAARVGRLAPETRRALQAVAVHGTVAPTWLVEATLEGPLHPSVAEALASGELTGLLVARDDELTIPTELVASVILESIPADVRHRLHRRAMISLLGRAPSGVIGHHAERSGALETAHRMFTQAGEESLRCFDADGAAAWFGRAVAVARALHATGADRAEIRFVGAATRLAELLCGRGQYGSCESLLGEIERLSLDGTHLAPVDRVRAHIALAHGDVETAVARLHDAIGTAIQAGDREFLCTAYLDLAAAMDRMGKPDAGTGELAQGIDVITAGEGLRSLNAPRQLWFLGLRLAERQFAAGELDSARETAQAAMTQARRVDSARGRGRLSALLARLSDRAGDEAAAIRHRACAIEELSHLGDRRSTAELLYQNANAARSGAARTLSDTATPSRGIRLANKLASEIGWDEGVSSPDSE